MDAGKERLRFPSAHSALPCPTRDWEFGRSSLQRKLLLPTFCLWLSWKTNLPFSTPPFQSRLYLTCSLTSRRWALGFSPATGCSGAPFPIIFFSYLGEAWSIPYILTLSVPILPVIVIRPRRPGNRQRLGLVAPTIHLEHLIALPF
ncbi:hypothetical protein BX600DRAFT_96364 [Xylariales sp. PMI_506]|nr:hypothetical protein BX600DRAFT_96364 [Xylariales sp. PMI_506]